MSLAVGSLKRENMIAEKDGECVSFLRDAGAIVILVSNTPENCLCWESNNLVTGKTLNPYDLERTPGGSSGGEVINFQYKPTINNQQQELLLI